MSQNDLPAASPDQDQGQSVVFIDDNTEQASDSDPDRLQAKLQQRADNVTSWLSDNSMVIAPDKTKLVVSATKELRSARLPTRLLAVKVGQNVITATPSEKLLGVVLGSDLTWSAHLWGESWRTEKNNTGLIPQLIRRLGLLKHLARLSSKGKMRSFVPAMFTSKILYALPLIASIWGLTQYAEIEPHKFSFTKHEIGRLQTLQRQAALLLCPAHHQDQPIPTTELLDEVRWLSVHQLAAHTTLALTVRIVQSGKPTYLAEKLVPATNSRTQQNSLVVPRCRLNVTFEGYVNQATRLYNLLPADIRCEPSKATLKKKLKLWTRDNIITKVTTGPVVQTAT